MSPAPTARRRPLVAANWKMNLLRAQVTAWARTLGADAADRALVRPGAAADVVVFPSAPLLDTAAAALDRHVPGVAWGGQDLHPAPEGAHTGDVAGQQLRDAGCSWVLCGHSERRRDHGESDAVVARKVAAARRDGLMPLLCVGETLAERHAGQTEAVLDRQLTAGIEPLRAAASEAGAPPFALAYEPVWAIGTGETASPEEAQAAHAFLRRRLASLLGAAAPAAAVRLLYGGSVTPENAPHLFAGEDVDGFLVGGASLDPVRFLAIIRVCAQAFRA